MSVAASDVPRSRVPGRRISDGLVEVRDRGHRAEAADEARRIIDEHRDRLPSGEVVRLRRRVRGLERRIGYRFRDRGLLEHAMTHTSRANEDVSGGVVDNESLEFLGDAVLGFVIADMLFREFPQFQRRAEVEG